MNVQTVYRTLRKKPNGMVSFKTVEREFRLTTGSLNRALTLFDTSEGISLEAFESLVSQGLIVLEAEKEIVEGELVFPDLSSQLSQFSKLTDYSLSPRPSGPTEIASQDFVMNGRLQTLLALQAQNQQLRGDIETLQENRGKALETWEKVELLEAELMAENRLLRKQREGEEIDNKALERQLKTMGIMGKPGE